MTDARLNLACNALRNEAGIQLRTLDFKNVDLNVLSGELLELFPQLVNLRSSLANDDTGTG